MTIKPYKDSSKHRGQACFDINFNVTINKDEINVKTGLAPVVVKGPNLIYIHK